MGHRFSKTAANNIASTATAGQEPTRSHEVRNQTQTTTTTAVNTVKQPVTFATTTTTRRIPIPNGNSNFIGPTINLQIQESPSGIGGIGATCHNNTSSTHTATAAAGILQQSSSIGCSSNSSSLTSVNNLSCGRQIIIKIQLAKMENGNEISASASTSSTTAPALLHHHQQLQQDISLETLTADCNLNSSELRTTTTGSSSSNNSGVLGAAQNLSLTLNAGSSDYSNNMTAATATTTTTQRTAGSSSSPSSSSTLATNNNYLNQNNSSTNFAASAMDASSTSMSLSERLGRFNNTLQFNDETVEQQNIGENVEYCEVLEDEHQPPLPLAINEEPEIESNVCCRRKSKSLAANGGAASSSSKRRCRKCSCRDAFRRILDPSLSRSSNKAQKQQQQLLEQERKEQKQQSRVHERHSIPNLPTNRSANALQQMQRNSMHSTNSTAATTASFVVPSVAAATTSSSANQVAVWGTATTTANGSDVIIPLTTPPQFVVVQCAIVNSTPAAANNTHHHHSTSSTTVSNSNLPNSIISITHNPSPSSTSSSANNEILVRNYGNVPQHSHPHPPTIRSSLPPSTAPIAAAAPIVHSQVDFVHYLVPDLERITNSSFYWGKMDRYEAERMLDGKPEGTFLLRDSAQEEFLFSVSFRKYGRSLHARIEQSGHRFSFDCHDPCVFTASTVTGLLEHYKDPACVMFFEPMLTIPLHRGNCFSLQQQCRATIVSNTTYDGINELELPARLKSYLKEYHYKQKLRVKLNEPTYTIHCK